MYTDVHPLIICNWGLLSVSSGFLLVGLLVVDAVRCDRLTISDDHSNFTLTVSEIFKNPSHRFI